MTSSRLRPLADNSSANKSARAYLQTSVANRVSKSPEKILGTDGHKARCSIEGFEALEEKMLRKMIIAAAFGLATIGAAVAQSGSGGGTTATDAQTGAQAAPGVLEDPVMMKPFYTDDTMQTLRPATEFGAAVKALSTNDRDKIAKQCENSTSQRDTFCQAFNDANKT